jgi:hypothetical protein
MNNSLINTLVLVAVTMVIAGAGYYMTELKHPEELQRIEDMRKAASLEYANVEELLQMEGVSAEMAEASLSKWRARYKFIPSKMATPDIVQYLERLTSTGFEETTIDLQGVTNRSNYSFYTFRINGTATYNALYDFVWHLENNREFYLVNDLELRHRDVFRENFATGRQRRIDMVQFSMRRNAYCNGGEGLSVPDSGMMAVPRTLLPDHYPAHNSFFPQVRADLPPNDEGLVDVEQAKLLSIVAGTAIFEYGGEQHQLREGDKVYLGEIVKIDPLEGTVRAALNKGGLATTVDVRMYTEEERFRSIQNPGVRVSPVPQQ